MECKAMVQGCTLVLVAGQCFNNTDKCDTDMEDDDERYQLCYSYILFIAVVMIILVCANFSKNIHGIQKAKLIHLSNSIPKVDVSSFNQTHSCVLMF